MDILKYDTNKARNPDSVNPKLLKKGASISLHLCKLLNTSLMTSSFPVAWKSTNVVPIYKKRMIKPIQQIIDLSL